MEALPEFSWRNVILHLVNERKSHSTLLFSETCRFRNTEWAPKSLCCIGNVWFQNYEWALKLRVLMDNIQNELFRMFASISASRIRAVVSVGSVGRWTICFLLSQRCARFAQASNSRNQKICFFDIHALRNERNRCWTLFHALHLREPRRWRQNAWRRR